MIRKQQRSSASIAKLVCAALSLILGFGTGGCSVTTCAKFCDACADGSNNCKEDCQDDYKDGDAECRAAMRDYADCVDDKGCGWACASEGLDMAATCY